MDSDNMPSARAGINETIVFPYVLPYWPQRNYFLFQEPIDTRDLNIYNKKECRLVYNSVQKRITEGIDTLLRFREEDFYSRFIPRVIYGITNGDREAPTAPLNRDYDDY
jgi:hypothetical protein